MKRSSRYNLLSRGVFVNSNMVAAAAVVVIALASAATVSGMPVGGPDASLSSLQETENTLVALIERVGESVVAIEAHRQPVRRTGKLSRNRNKAERVSVLGSGFVITSDGLILTNEHVVRHCDPIEVTVSGGRVYRAELVGSDARSDLAVLKIEETGLSPAVLGDIGSVRRGQWTVAMGNPLGLCFDGQAAASLGIVSAIGRYVPGVDTKLDRYYGNLIQTTAQINVGNSGGPLFNLQGEVIGINTIVSTTQISGGPAAFAIPITKWTRRVIDSLRKGEHIERGYLGVTIDRVRGQEGAAVQKVTVGTPAYEAGLRAGDVVTEYDGETIRNADDLICLIGLTRPGRRITLRIDRTSTTFTTSVIIAHRKQFVAAAAAAGPSSAPKHAGAGK